MTNTIITTAPKAAAMSTIGGVVVIDLGEYPAALRTVGSIGEWENREVFEELFKRAASKLGYKRDKKCRFGFRKLASLA